MTAFMVLGACLAVGLLRLYRLAVPSRTDLVAGVGGWDRDRARASRIQRIGAPTPRGWRAKLTARLTEVADRHSRRLPGLRQDLAATGTTLEEHLTKVLGLMAAGFFGPIIVLMLLSGLGLGLPVWCAPLLGVGLAAGMLVASHRELTTAADSRRAEFRRTLSIYLDLVAMSLQAGRGHAEALPAAAAIGTGRAFTDLQEAIDGARFSGITPSRALGQLGERLGIPELVDLEAALQLANEDGAKVKATLLARAGTLRDQRIADAEAEANKATESMKFALIAMVFVFLTYELYPSIARLFAG